MKPRVAPTGPRPVLRASGVRGAPAHRRNQTAQVARRPMGPRAARRGPATPRVRVQAAGSRMARPARATPKMTGRTAEVHLLEPRAPDPTVAAASPTSTEPAPSPDPATGPARAQPRRRGMHRERRPLETGWDAFDSKKTCRATDGVCARARRAPRNGYGSLALRTKRVATVSMKNNTPSSPATVSAQSPYCAEPVRMAHGQRKRDRRSNSPFLLSRVPADMLGAGPLPPARASGRANARPYRARVTDRGTGAKRG
jgi:hypothetical protein